MELEEPEEERSPEDLVAHNEWKRKKSEARAKFAAMQSLPYEVKVRRAEARAHEFISEMDKRGKNAHVSVGGGRQHHVAGIFEKHRNQCSSNISIQPGR